MPIEFSDDEMPEPAIVQDPQEVEEEEADFLAQQRRDKRAHSRNMNSAGSSEGDSGNTSRRRDTAIEGKLDPPREPSPQLEQIVEESKSQAEVTSNVSSSSFYDRRPRMD